MSSGKVMLVTGSSSGMGATTAMLAAKEGYNVVITGRNTQALEIVRTNIVKQNGVKPTQVLTLAGDLNDIEHRRTMVEKTIQQFGKLNVLVNNAGILPTTVTLESAKIEDLDTVMNTNTRSLVHLTKICMPHLVKTKGAVINISSIASTSASALFMFYCMSKAAVDMFTKCLALDVAAKGVTVNAINPGLIRTPAFESQIPKEPERAAKFKGMMAAMHPVGRYGEPEEVGELVLYLASDKAKFITGQCMKIDGGRTVGAPVSLAAMMQQS